MVFLAAVEEVVFFFAVLEEVEVFFFAVLEEDEVFFFAELEEEEEVFFFPEVEEEVFFFPDEDEEVFFFPEVFLPSSSVEVLISPPMVLSKSAFPKRAPSKPEPWDAGFSSSSSSSLLSEDESRGSTRVRISVT